MTQAIDLGGRRGGGEPADAPRGAATRSSKSPAIPRVRPRPPFRPSGAGRAPGPGGSQERQQTGEGPGPNFSWEFLLGRLKPAGTAPTRLLPARGPVLAVRILHGTSPPPPAPPSGPWEGWTGPATTEQGSDGRVPKGWRPAPAAGWEGWGHGRALRKVGEFNVPPAPRVHLGTGSSRRGELPELPPRGGAPASAAPPPPSGGGTVRGRGHGVAGGRERAGSRPPVPHWHQGGPTGPNLLKIPTFSN